MVAKETIELAFLVALQHLPPRPRAVLIVRDVLGWSAKETADLLETSVAAVNSALQRARAALQERLPERRDEWVAGADPDAAERALIERYVEASERGDGAALAAMMAEDARFSMPPDAEAYTGRDAIVQGWIDGGFGTEEFGDIRCLATRANRSAAVACYVRRPGDDRHRPLALDVLRVVDGRDRGDHDVHAGGLRRVRTARRALMEGFELRSVSLAPGGERPYDADEWRDALVVVGRGRVELESRGGRRHAFGRGETLWLTGLPLRSVRNPGREPAVLIAVWRRR